MSLDERMNLDERMKGIFNSITFQDKLQILDSMKNEFAIHIKASDDFNQVYFRKCELSFDAPCGLWGSDPPLDNIRYVCERLYVEYKGSNTEKICQKLREEIETKLSK